MAILNKTVSHHLLITLQQTSYNYHQIMECSRLRLITVRTSCPAGFTVHSSEFNSCYMFVDVFMTWYAAEAYCYSNGAHLVGFETESEQDFLLNQMERSDSSK